MVHEWPPAHVLKVFDKQLLLGEHPIKKLEIVDFPTPVAPRTISLGLGKDFSFLAKNCFMMNSKVFESSMRAKIAGSVKL